MRLRLQHLQLKRLILTVLYQAGCELALRSALRCCSQVRSTGDRKVAWLGESAIAKRT